MNEFLPGFEPDAAERAQLRFVGGVLDLRQFDKILVSISGGKDSHAMLWLVRDLADRQGVPRDRLLAVYADTGMEWHNAGAHVQALCKAAGVELATVYPVRPMIEKIAFRIERVKKAGKSQAGFPTPDCRYCTSEQKVEPMDKLIRRYSGKVLKVTGERIAELEAERDRLREALQIIASGHFSGTVELVNTEKMKTVWKSDVGLPMTVSEARDIARKALEGIGK